jgi:hypothetical protein
MLRSSPSARQVGRSVIGVFWIAPSTSPSNHVRCAPQRAERPGYRSSSGEQKTNVPALVERSSIWPPIPGSVHHWHTGGASKRRGVESCSDASLPNKGSRRRMRGPIAERCRSGRSGRSRKPLTFHEVQGFESLPLRQFFGNVRRLWRGVRVAEGARLESVCGGNSTAGSNPALSAT